MTSLMTRSPTADPNPKVWPVFTASRVAVCGPAQVKSADAVPVPVSCSDMSTSLPLSLKPMSVLVMPLAAPAVAVTVPS